MDGQEQEELLTTVWDLQGCKVFGIDTELASAESEAGRRIRVVSLFNERPTHRYPKCGAGPGFHRTASKPQRSMHSRFGSTPFARTPRRGFSTDFVQDCYGAGEGSRNGHGH